jgi:hypothetical protein
MAGEAEVRAMTEVANGSLKATIEILRLLSSLAVRAKSFSNQSSKELNLPSGAVEYSKLKAAADKRGETLSTQDGISEKYLPQIRKSAKNYGMSVAAVGGKDVNGNYTMAFRGKDRELFQQIMNDVLKTEMAARPEKFTSVQLKDWEVIPMQSELERNGVNAVIVKSDKGDYHCVFQNEDRAKIDLINRDFTKAHTEVVEKFGVKHTDEMFVLQDKSTGKQAVLPKDGAYSANDITDKLMKEFGYDKTKATIAAWSFADNLDAEKKQDFFEINALSEVHLDSESMLVQDYKFYRVNLKENGIDQFVVMDKNAQIAVLEADNLKNREILNGMGVTDKSTVDALLEKNAVLHDIFNNRANELCEIVGDNAKLEINRLDKNNFEVRSGEEVRGFSFSDRKATVDELAMFINGNTNVCAGYVEARVIAEQAFKNAQQQSFIQGVQEVEKSQLPEYEINREVGGTFSVKFGDMEERYSLDDKEISLSNLKEDFGLTDEKAERIFDKALEQNAIEAEVAQADMPEMPPVNENMIRPEIPDDFFEHDLE